MDLLFNMPRAFGHFSWQYGFFAGAKPATYYMKSK